MIYASGTIKGKDYELQPVKLQDVIKAYNVPFDGTGKVEFELNPALVQEDTLNGGVRHRPRAAVGNTINATMNMETAELIFCNAAPRKDKEGVVRSVPRHYHYEGRNMLLNEKEAQLQVFLYLHPLCRESPFRNGGRWEWSLVDRKAEAREKNKAAQVIIDLIKEINDEQNIGKLKRIARGLGFTANGAYISIPESRVNDDEVAAELVQIAMKYPKEFGVAFRDANTILWGAVREAKDKGLIMLHGVGGGMSEWRWKADNVKFCDVPMGVSQENALFNRCNSIDGEIELIKRLDGVVVNRGTVAEATTLTGESAKKLPSEMTAKELVAEAMKLAKVEFNGKDAWIVVDEKTGDQKGKQLCKITSKPQKVQNLIDSVEADPEIRARLEAEFVEKQA